MSIPVDQTDFFCNLRVLLVDNYDSYTFNLFQLFADLVTSCSSSSNNDNQPGSVVVMRNNDPKLIQIINKAQLHERFDAIVLSPGPGRPDHVDDFGLCKRILQYEYTKKKENKSQKIIRIPTFGVCLGHQGIGIEYGLRVIKAREVMHGRLSGVEHCGEGDPASLFFGIPSPFQVVRYHSLIVVQDNTGGGGESSSSCPLGVFGVVKQTVEDEEEEIMAMRHVDFPLWGVQFHPESVCTEYGKMIAMNFLRLAQEYITENELGITRRRQTKKEEERVMRVDGVVNSDEKKKKGKRDDDAFEYDNVVYVRKITSQFIASQVLFDLLYENNNTRQDGKENEEEEDVDQCFWLDSSKLQSGLSRFSFMGDYLGGSSIQLQYFLDDKRLVRSKPQGQHTMHPAQTERGDDSEEGVSILRGDDMFLSELNKVMKAYELGIVSEQSRKDDDEKYKRSGPRLVDEHGHACTVPFDFKCGFVGYLGYEMKNECGALGEQNRAGSDRGKEESEKVKVNEGDQDTMTIPTKLPDAFYALADRLIAFDHKTECIYLLHLVRRKRGEQWGQDFADVPGDVTDWMNKVNDAISRIHSGDYQDSFAAPYINHTDGEFLDFKLVQDQESYLESIQECFRQFREGESYEICLTTRMHSQSTPDPYVLYRLLRERNPAPYAAFLRLNRDATIVCSSPERFLKVFSTRLAEIKPIKGTTARGKTAEEDEKLRQGLGKNAKDFAENLMILDLIRNDLGEVCEVGSVYVPKMMNVETYATVHQLVSTVCGTLRDGKSAIDCISAIFPAGSMTGAPKLRTMQILERVEKHEKRGIYSGCVGFLSLDGSAADLAVVIRTVVIERELGMYIGAGGAIVQLSDPDAEFDEMLLKARAPLSCIANSLGLDRSAVRLEGITREGTSLF
eukprot:Nk52_evm5s738 gene=Nk52_evmTU5s738